MLRNIVVMPFILLIFSRQYFIKKQDLYTLLKLNLTRIITIFKTGPMYRCSYHLVLFVRCVI